MTPREKYSPAFFRQLTAVLRPAGFARRGNRYYRQWGDAKQVVLVASFKSPTEGTWEFHVYHGATTDRTFLAMYPMHQLPSHPERGPVFYAPFWDAPSGYPDHFTILYENDVIEAGQMCEKYFRDEILPELDALDSDEAIVKLLSEHPEKSPAHREKVKEFLERYYSSTK